MNLFAYGTLMVPEVLRAVTGRDFRWHEAVLRGYLCLKVRAATYPGLFAFPDRQTEGVVYIDVDADSLERIDVFEGDFYERHDVTVETTDGEWIEAITYIVKPGHEKLLSSDPWDEYDFRENHLSQFLRSYKGFSRLETAGPDRKKHS